MRYWLLGYIGLATVMVALLAPAPAHRPFVVTGPVDMIAHDPARGWSVCGRGEWAIVEQLPDGRLAFFSDGRWKTREEAEAYLRSR